MAYQCEICGKTKQYGHNVSFSQRKTNRTFKPNLQTKRLKLGPNRVTVKICAQCLRRLKLKAKQATPKEPVQTPS